MRPAAIWLAVLLAVLLAATACQPVPPRSGTSATPSPLETSTPGLFDYQPEARPLRIGATVPNFVLVDRHGGLHELRRTSGKAVILGFIADNAGGPDEEMLNLWNQVELPETLAEDVERVLVLLDPSNEPMAALAAFADRTNHAALDLRAAESPGVAGALAAAFGVAVWESTDGNVMHTFNTVVIDGNGRFADQFPGIGAWSPMDVVAGAQAATR